MKISIKGMQLSTVKTIIYVLLGLALIAGAYLLLYEHLIYYLFQVFLSWAFLFRFLILFGLVFIVIYLFQLVDKFLYGTHLTIGFNEKALEFRTARNTYQIPYGQLKSLTLTKKKDIYSTLSVQADQPLNFVLGSWVGSLNAPEFENFRNALKKELKQQGFEYKSEAGKQGKTTVVQELFCKDYSDYLNKQNKKKKRTFIYLGIFFVFVIVLVVFLIRAFSHDGISIRDGEKIGSSYYEKYQNKVYFLKIGDGYFPLPEANPSTFRALQTEGEVFSEAGTDQQHAYWQNHKLTLLSPATSVYLGGAYTKDTQHVYFRDQLLTQADVATFQALKHSQYNTPVYYFGKDKNRIYYRTIPLPGLETETARSFDNSSRYVKDRQKVFYKNSLLKGLDAQRTKVYDPDHYRAAYATDGQHHYLNEEAVPTTASNKYFGTTDIDLSTFKLLLPAGGGSYLYLFGDSRHLYFYDEKYTKMVMVYTFDQPVELRALDNGNFTDGKFTYTLNVRKISARSRTMTTTYGYDAKILRIENLQNPIEIGSYAARIVEWREKD